MSRPTHVEDYKHAWQELGKETYKVEADRIEPVLQVEKPTDTLAPRYIALHEDGVYVLIGVGDDNHNIVGAFEMDEEPEKPTWPELSTTDHARDRMVQRGITTGTMNEMFSDYLWWDRLAYRLYKTVSIIDGDDYHAIIDVGKNEIRTVWRS